MGHLHGTYAGHNCFHVEDWPTRTAETKLHFTWGSFAPATQRLQGRLSDFRWGKGGTFAWNLSHGVSLPIADAKLSAWNPITNSTYQASSDGQGEFAFGEMPEGTYVLHVEGGRAGKWDYEGTDLIVRIDHNLSRGATILTRREATLGGCGGTDLEFQRE